LQATKDNKEEPKINNNNGENETIDKKFLLQICQDLDRHYVQPRYPNAFPSGYPAEFYNQKQARKCIEYARSIIKYVKNKITEISSS